MNRKHQHRVILGGLWGIILCGTVGVRAKTPAAEAWIDVPVLVNILDGAQADNIDAAIRKANEAYAPARIRLVKKAVDPNARGDTDGSGALNRAERNAARAAGQRALNRALGAGRGVKIDIGKDIDAADAATVGFAIHRNPVILIEPNADSNELGNTLAHELGHVFSLGYDLYDANDRNRLMYGYTGGGTALDPNEVREIRSGARRRGRSYIRSPRVLPGRNVAIPAGFDPLLEAHGAVLDDFSDVEAFGFSGSIDPHDPRVQYGDIREVVVHASDPLDPQGLLTVDVQFGPSREGDFRVDSFFDVFFFPPDAPDDPIGGLQIQLEDGALREATWFNDQGPTTEPVEVFVHRNDLYAGQGRDPVLHNRSIEARIPIELVALDLQGVAPILVHTQTVHNDWSLGSPTFPVQIFDQTERFPLVIQDPCPPPTIKLFGGQVAPQVRCLQGLPYQIGVTGSGFAPGQGLDILIDGSTLGQTVADGQGRFLAAKVLACLEAGPVHEVLVREQDMSLDGGGGSTRPGRPGTVGTMPEPDASLGRGVAGVASGFFLVPDPTGSGTSDTP